MTNHDISIEAVKAAPTVTGYIEIIDDGTVRRLAVIG